ncbi:serine hydrolase domain-containing protein [Gynurincola endophyticus]|uniref:serine hydrolase domain-containing protein n=1 Tax=Gynurincola endophyticus TaxID=2479004 RepID=UPI000F8D8840|nr:serine hydrolase domain-containing protein [Gynurincola endophyticus]
MIIKHKLLQKILDSAVDNKKIFGTSFCIKHGKENWCGASGNLGTDQSYFIASTTKLFITAIILRYRSQGLLDLNDRIGKYLSSDIVAGLNVVKGRDYSHEITIRDLLAHTSGIPDYFQKKDASGNSWENQLLSGIDFSWTFDEAIARSKSLPPPFPPGAKNKAHYSDTNFQLLGKIIEFISQEQIQKVYEEQLFEPLNLKRTYQYSDKLDIRPKPLYYKNKILHIPQAMSSFGADGGMVSTSREMMVFLHAFFTGVLFPYEYLEELTQWKPIFFPLQSGIGIHRFKLLWIFNPTGAIPALIGHSGLSGAVAFCNPEKNLYISGTVNQVAYADSSFRLMIKLMQTLL